MNNEEAIQLLARELLGFRDESYLDLVGRIPAGSLDYQRSAAGGVK